MQSPLVSVLIPCFNHEKYVQECIKSIIAQDYENIELLIIDDGSKDNSFEKIFELKSECENRFKSFFCEKQPNSGCNVTINKLLEKANGEFVFVIASDDVAMPEIISSELRYFDQDTVIVVGDDYIIDADSNIVGWDKNRNCVPIENAEYKTFMAAIKDNSEVLQQDINNFGSYDVLCKGNHIPNGQLVRKSALIKIGGYNTKAPLEDWYMNLQMSKIGKIKFTGKTLFKYRWHNSNTVKNREKMANASLNTYFFEKELLLSVNDIERFKIWKRNDRTFISCFFVYFDLVVREKKSDLKKMLNLCYENILSPTKKQKIFHLIANNFFAGVIFRIYSKIKKHKHI